MKDKKIKIRTSPDKILKDACSAAQDCPSGERDEYGVCSFCFQFLVECYCEDVVQYKKSKMKVTRCCTMEDCEAMAMLVTLEKTKR